MERAQDELKLEEPPELEDSLELRRFLGAEDSWKLGEFPEV